MNETLIYPFQLFDVRLYEVNIERLEPEDDKTSDIENEGGVEEGPSLLIGRGMKAHSERELSVFLNCNVRGPDCENPEFVLKITLEGMFEIQVDYDDVDPEMRKEFEEHSSLSLLWPFARELLDHFAVRMRVILPMLPTLNQANFEEVILPIDDKKEIPE